MTRTTTRCARRTAAAALLAWGMAGAQSDELSRGEYVLRIGGCVHCHTADDGETLGGGRALPTPFGTFYTPNISAHPDAGIGAWSETDFLRALRDGVAPDGSRYFPSFPYPSYTRMHEDDARALYAHLMSLPPSAQRNREHDLPWYLRWRFAARLWQWLYFEPGVLRARSGEPAAADSGAYLAEALGHCQECHTPRNLLGALNAERAYAGNPDGPDGEKVPNITPHRQAGIGDWAREDLLDFLASGERPDGEYAAGSMEPVIEALIALSAPDREALVDYLRALPPIANDE